MTVQDQDWLLRTRADKEAGRDAFERAKSQGTAEQRRAKRGRSWIGAAVMSALLAAAVLVVFKLAIRHWA
jgi:hypothetical protein